MVEGGAGGRKQVGVAGEVRVVISLVSFQSVLEATGSGDACERSGSWFGVQ